MADQEEPQSPQPRFEQDCRQTIHTANLENRMMVPDVDVVMRQSVGESIKADQQASQPQASQPQTSQPQTSQPQTSQPQTSQPQTDQTQTQSPKTNK